MFNQLKYIKPFLCFICILLFIMFSANISMSSMHEQIGTLNAKAMALANTVTADPPGLMAIHYNPAGLSNIPDGKYVSINGLAAGFSIKGKFTKPNDFNGFGEPDPLFNTEGSNSNALVYIPGVDSTMAMPALVAPSSFQISYREPKSKWTFAVGSYIPYAGGWTFEGKDNPVRYQCKEMYHEHIIAAAPSVSYKLNDALSVGMSVGLGISAMGMSMDMRAPSDLTGVIKPLGELMKLFSTIPEGWGIGPYENLASIKMNLNDDFTPSMNFGLLWQPKKYFSFGAAYQGPTNTKLEGKYTIKYEKGFQTTVNWMATDTVAQVISAILSLPTHVDPEQKGMCNTEFTLPQMLHFGVMVRPIPQVKLLCDYHWANWSAMKEMRVQFDQSIALLQLVKPFDAGRSLKDTMVLEMGLKDTWHLGYGFVYEPTDWLALRLGYEKRESSVPDDKYSLILPLPDLEFYGAGLGIKRKDGIDIDLGLGCLFNKSYKVKKDQSTLFNSMDATRMIYNPYAGLEYEQETFIYAGSLTVTMPTQILMDMLEDLYDKYYPFKKSKKG